MSRNHHLRMARKRISGRGRARILDLVRRRGFLPSRADNRFVATDGEFQDRLDAVVADTRNALNRIPVLIRGK